VRGKTLFARFTFQSHHLTERRHEGILSNRKFAGGVKLDRQPHRPAIGAGKVPQKRRIFKRPDARRNHQFYLYYAFNCIDKQDSKNLRRNSDAMRGGLEQKPERSGYQ